MVSKCYDLMIFVNHLTSSGALLVSFWHTRAIRLPHSGTYPGNLRHTYACRPPSRRGSDSRTHCAYTGFEAMPASYTIYIMYSSRARSCVSTVPDADAVGFLLGMGKNKAEKHHCVVVAAQPEALLHCRHIDDATGAAGPHHQPKQFERVVHQ